ncbi:bifunctional DNA primase/polymerase [Salmonella enterica subsp. enterica serovar Newport]
MNYWQEYGETLWGNGYTVVPIYAPDADKKGAGKRPIGKDWERTINDKEQIQRWAERYTKNGIGILTKNTPAVDIDVYDETAAEHMADWLVKNVGRAPCRIGREPKKLFLFRTESPFSKVKSGVWEDDFGQRHAVEVLADGQQFVAYGIHPDTRKDYYWIDDENPLNNAADFDLEEISLDTARAITAEFDRYAAEQGWTRVKRPMNGYEAVGTADDEDWAANADIRKWDRTYEELHELVMKYPNPEDYENYIKVLAALQISCRDQDEAKMIARDWAMQAHNFDADDFEYKWDKGFSHDATRLVTIASIIKEVKDKQLEEQEQQAVDFKEAFEACTSEAEWNTWAADFKKAEIFGKRRRDVVRVAAEAYHRVFKTRLTAEDKKLDLAFDHTTRKMPNWLRNYVFSVANDSFIRKSTGDYISKGAFDVSNAPFCKFEDDTFKPTEYASKINPVPMIHDAMYYPAMHGDMDESLWRNVPGGYGTEFFFDEAGRQWFNSFDPESIPKAAESLSPYDKKAIEIIKDFFVVLFPNDKERRYVMDWMAWVIQHPTKRINYSLLIRGAHGSGKTTLGILMSRMLGQRNVGYVSNTVMNGRFSDWAEGDILKIVEEVYDKGDRYSAIERQKEYITNDRFQVEPKGLKPKVVMNTSSKMMFTNHFNALPLDENQRRYLVVSTQAENHLDMERVYGSKVERSRFFKNVYRAIDNHVPAIKKWFMDWEISAEFDHKGHAPQDTEAFAIMADASNDGVEGAVVSMLRDGTTHGVNRDVIFVPSLKDAFLEMEDVEMPKTSRLKNMLMEIGFKPGGVLCFGGKSGRVYIRKRVKGAFDEDGKLNSDWAQKTLKKHNAEVEKIIGKKSPKEWDDEV